MTHPNVHLNGTSREQLTEDYGEALLTVSKAINVLVERASPHARDYHGMTIAFQAAVTEHAVRLAKLRVVRDELDEIYTKLRTEGA